MRSQVFPWSRLLVSGAKLTAPQVETGKIDANLLILTAQLTLRLTRREVWREPDSGRHIGHA